MNATPDDQPVEETVLFVNGRVKYNGFRLGGEMHGAWSWYRTDGSLIRTGEFGRGHQVGTWRTFDRAGKSSRRRPSATDHCTRSQAL